MVLLIALAQTLQNQESLVSVWWLNHDGLESTLQRRVLLDVLAVLIESGCADALNFTTGQGWLEHVRRIDGAFCSAGTNQGVQFIDEQNDVLGATHLVHHCLDALFKLSAVLGAGNHAGQVKHHQALVKQKIRDLLRQDALRKTFNDGSLADASFAQQHGVVLGATAENLNQTLNFRLTPDDRVKLAALGKLSEIAAE